MPESLILDELHERLVRDTLGPRLNEDQAFLIFSLFHTHQIELTGPVISNCPGIDRFPALTQRSCASVLASFWSGKDDPRATYEHWYWKWNTDWDSGYNLTQEQSEGLRQLIVKFEAHPLVFRIIPDED